MLMFGLFFILYFVKLSVGIGYSSTNHALFPERNSVLHVMMRHIYFTQANTVTVSFFVN